MLRKSQMLRIAALAALIGLGVAAFMREGKPATIIVTASPLVTATPRPVHKAAARMPEPAPTESGAPEKWTFYYSCRAVRFYSAIMSESQLEALRIKYKKPKPTPTQLRQIKECIAGKKFS